MVTPSPNLPKPAFPASVAVARFLSDMATVSKETFPTWHKTLADGINECPLEADARRAVLDIHPLDDYYFAGVVALEASKIRQLFSTEEAAELLSLIGEQADAAAGRKDRLVSDLVFFIISRMDIAANADNHKMPYDQVVKAILQRLGVDKIKATEHLMTEALYRHTLGEPLALRVPHWWSTFRKKYAFAEKTDNVSAAVDDAIPVVSASVASSARRRAPRRAVAF